MLLLLLDSSDSLCSSSLPPLAPSTNKTGSHQLHSWPCEGPPCNGAQQAEPACERSRQPLPHSVAGTERSATRAEQASVVCWL